MRASAAVSVILKVSPVLDACPIIDAWAKNVATSPPIIPGSQTQSIQKFLVPCSSFVEVSSSFGKFGQPNRSSWITLCKTFSHTKVEVQNRIF
jgi:hypothetical protein